MKGDRKYLQGQWSYFSCFGHYSDQSMTQCMLQNTSDSLCTNDKLQLVMLKVALMSFYGYVDIDK